MPGSTAKTSKLVSPTVRHAVGRGVRESDRDLQGTRQQGKVRALPVEHQEFGGLPGRVGSVSLVTFQPGPDGVGRTITESADRDWRLPCPYPWEAWLVCGYKASEPSCASCRATTEHGRVTENPLILLLRPNAWPHGSRRGACAANIGTLRVVSMSLPHAIAVARLRLKGCTFCFSPRLPHLQADACLPVQSSGVLMDDRPVK
jgi:hypothetical protein